MRKLSLLVSVVVAAGMLAACKGDARLTTFVTSPDAGTVEGYVGGTPITLFDGTPVTLVDGTAVTSPKIKGAKSSSGKNNNGSSDDIDDSDVATPVGGGGSTTNTTRLSTTQTTIKTTGTTSVTAPAEVFHLAAPKTGIYTFHQTIVPDDGSPSDDSELNYRYTGNGAATVRIQTTDAAGAITAPDYYEETYGTDGLFLTNSALDGDPCVWSPKAVSLPQSIIEDGKASKKVTTKSSCSTQYNGQTVTYNLEVTVGFKVFKQVVFGGKTYDAIDVTRHRVLTHDNETITSDAVDTYAFNLGIRIATSDHSISNDGKNIRAATRNLVLVKLPA